MKKWYLDYEAAEETCKKEGNEYDIVALPGHSRREDYYLLVKKGTTLIRGIPQTEAKKRYGVWDIIYVCHEGHFTPARKYRYAKWQKSGLPLTDEAREYMQGHRTGTEYFRKKINKYKEAARISHTICDTSGMEGHRIRQSIRHSLV